MSNLFEGTSPLPWRAPAGDLIDANGNLIVTAGPEGEANLVMIVAAVRVLHALSQWAIYFEPKELQEISFDQVYLEMGAFGTAGHNMRRLIGRMANLLEALSRGEVRR